MTPLKRPYCPVTHAYEVFQLWKTVCSAGETVQKLRAKCRMKETGKVRAP